MLKKLIILRHYEKAQRIQLYCVEAMNDILRDGNPDMWITIKNYIMHCILSKWIGLEYACLFHLDCRDCAVVSCQISICYYTLCLPVHLKRD